MGSYVSKNVEIENKYCFECTESGYGKTTPSECTDDMIQCEKCGKWFSPIWFKVCKNCSTQYSLCAACGQSVAERTLESTQE